MRDGFGGDAESLGAFQTPRSRAKTSPLDIWVAGHFGRLSHGDASGQYGVVYVGADYVVSPKLLVGVMGQFDTLTQRSSANAYETSGNGWLIGPYATLRLSEHLYAQGRIEAGRSSNSVCPFLTYTDQFDTSRWLASGALVGDWRHGGWYLRPSATIGYIDDTSEAYVDSFGALIPSVRRTLRQAKLDPSVSYHQMLPDGTVLEPSASLQAIWNFSGDDGAATTFEGTLGGPEGLRGKLQLGLKALLTDGVSVDLSGSYDGIGAADYQAVEGSAAVRFPLNRCCSAKSELER
jgi:outer membrane autotransporter protein